MRNSLKSHLKKTFINRNLQLVVLLPFAPPLHDTPCKFQDVTVQQYQCKIHTFFLLPQIKNMHIALHFLAYLPSTDYVKLCNAMQYQLKIKYSTIFFLSLSTKSISFSELELELEFTFHSRVGQQNQQQP